MARNETVVDAPPDAVYAVLADPARYPDWVVGAKHVRAVEGNWPDPGARFHHTLGVGPVEVHDHTETVEAVPGRRLVLTARARPAGSARVVIDLRPEAEGGTRVVMEEFPVSGLAALIPRRLIDPFTFVRNVESLRRLKRLVEERNGAATAPD